MCSGDICVAPEGDAGVDGGTGGTGVCNSDFTFEPDIRSECASESCCAAFDPCFADSVCRGCLDAQTLECDSDPLYTSLVECLDTNCLLKFCDSSVGFVAGDDPLACNGCIDTNCCVDVTACVGGAGEPEINSCLACIGDSEGSACLAAPMVIQDAAEDFLTCVSGSCPTECSGLNL